MTFRSVSDNGTTNALTVSKNWLVLHGARSIALEWDIPGFRAEWSVNVPVQRFLSIVDWDSERSRASTIAE
jgi:hypothetical protein